MKILHKKVVIVIPGWLLALLVVDLVLSITFTTLRLLGYFK